MSEFARVLGEIIHQGKKTKVFSIKELAQHAQITASYLSNLKQLNRKPPAHKTLLKLTEGLRKLDVSETDIQRLIDAYNRQHLNYQEEGKLLESLIDDYKEEGNLFERVKQGVQTKGLVLKKHAEKQRAFEDEIAGAEFFEGDHHAFIVRAIRLLEKTHDSGGDKGGKIYITWFHHDLLNEAFSRDREKLRDMLRSFLWADSPFQAFHLWAGDIAREITVIVDFLAQYIGTSHCFLYEIPYGQNLPEYLVVEGVGYIEARPLLDNYYWIRSVFVNPEETDQMAELDALIRYLEYLMGSQEVRKPLVKTNAPSKRFSITPITRKLADVEEENLKTELLLIKPSLSARHRPAEYVRAILEASGLPQDRIDTFVIHHLERVATQEKRIERGKGRTIHEREFLKKDFRDILTHIMPDPSKEHAVWTLEARLLRGQILGVLRTLKRNPNIHFALANQEFLIRFSLSGDTAFLSFDPPEAQGESPLNRDDLLVRACTEHPEVVYQLRHEFNRIWKNIDPHWRTDHEHGRRNVVNFFITEPLKVLLDANVPSQELWPFTCELIEQAAYLDAETFIRELGMYEQGAHEIFILGNSFPLITMPTNVGPWDARSSVRTRQLVFHTLVRDIKHVHLVISQKRIEKYWESGRYEMYKFTREWVAQHIQYLHDLLLKFPDKITLELIPQQDQFPVNFEVINGEYVFFQKAETADEQGGIILHDRELAEKLMTYITRNFSAACPKHLKDAQNVAKWFEERFGVKALNI